MALAPPGAARFEAPRDGGRPGRSTWEALGAIDVGIHQKPTGVLAAALAKGVDRMEHDAGRRKRPANPTGRRPINAWLKAGVGDSGARLPSEEGTPQGGTLSPLLAHSALHGLAHRLTDAVPHKQKAPTVIRYAEDLALDTPTAP